ncbi:MAG: DUF2510 domain-containing protein [Propioniciclava sp.]|uniref:DUF2510 domain-containing protein n=1 Tax=Propioniciclava sp. TaxID=2038686 RepID=UPI0039E6A4BD
MSKAGWYPDPGGQAGMYRWWDGQAWTPMLTANPYSPPPAPPAGLLPMQDAATASGDPYAAYRQAETQRSSRRGPLLVLVIVGVLLAGLIWGVTSLLGGGLLNPRPSVGTNPTENFCPPRTIQVSPRPHTAAPGRVQGGALSYPQLDSPWERVQPDFRVPFGADAWGQSVMLYPNYNNDGLSSWVASVLVAELVAGDGFFSPQEGAQIVSRCVLGEFYGNAEVQRTDRVNEATTIDGHAAWVIEMHLSFDIPNLPETGETAILVIVNTSEESSSLYYASIPDSRPDLLQTARQLQTQLRVES